MEVVSSRELVFSVLREFTSTPVDDATDVVKDGILDSIEFIDYLVRVEMAASCKIEESDIRTHRLATINNLTTFIDSHRPNASPASST